MKSNNSILKTIGVSLVLCLVCSSVISFAAVSLKEKQEANVLRDKQQTILAAAGLLKEQESVDQIFASISEKIINLDTGDYDFTIDLSSYSQKDYSKNELTSKKLVPKEDIAVIKRRENFAKVYLYYKDEVLEAIILPVRGLGL